MNHRVDRLLDRSIVLDWLLGTLTDGVLRYGWATGTTTFCRREHRALESRRIRLEASRGVSALEAMLRQQHDGRSA